MSEAPPVVLVAAGSDPSGGAGLQADLKVMADHGVYGAAAVTALTVQNTRGVREVHPVAPALVREQLGAVLEDLPVAAIKLGMLGELGVLRAVAGLLAERARGVPVVLDPVLRASSGAALLEAEALDALLCELLPHVTLITPNLLELATLERGLPLAERCRRLGVALLIKGGHGEGELLEDRLLLPDGVECRYTHPRQPAGNLHGTGCVLSSAIAARIARGAPLRQAVGGAIGYLQGRIAAGVGWQLGGGEGPLPVGLEPGRH
jgi:hydroxymethylpyrimidine/phosphomethylpyrimidine kinase